MTNAETLAKAILDIEAVIGAYLEPGHEQDPKRTLETIMLVMDRADVVGTAERVLSGYIGPTLVK
jgi:hypothetical protein